MNKALLELIGDLSARSAADGGYHEDRELADRILIADGWRVCPDPKFEGGVRWERGANPIYSSSETNRPHPVQDFNAAFGLIPFKAEYRVKAKLQKVPGRVVPVMHYLAEIKMIGPGGEGSWIPGVSDELPIAIAIAALRVRLFAELAGARVAA